MANVGYVRVSSIQQNTERQLDGVKLDKVFTEKVSGKNADRPELKAMLAYIREGDVIHCHELSRLGRNVKDLLEIIDTVKAKGASIDFHKERLTAGANENAVSKMMLNVLASVAQMEREMMLERQAEGYAAAKAAGRVVGRGNSKNIDRAAIIADLQQGKSLRITAKDNGVSLNTVYRVQQEAKEAGALQ